MLEVEGETLREIERDDISIKVLTGLLKRFFIGGTESENIVLGGQSAETVVLGWVAKDHSAAVEDFQVVWNIKGKDRRYRARLK